VLAATLVAVALMYALREPPRRVTPLAAAWCIAVVASTIACLIFRCSSSPQHAFAVCVYMGSCVRCDARLLPSEEFTPPRFVLSLVMLALQFSP
jgi:hypothetical protein